MGSKSPGAGGTDRLAWSCIQMSTKTVVSAPAFATTGNRRMTGRKPPNPTGADKKNARAGATREDGVMRWVERKPLRSLATGPPVASSSTMTAAVSATKREAAKQKTRGRLNRAVLAMLGKGLEDCFDEVRRQEVPERFKLLLQQF
jgi:hypothetical protein